jgi:hypothetical protein
MLAFRNVSFGYCSEYVDWRLSVVQWSFKDGNYAYHQLVKFKSTVFSTEGAFLCVTYESFCNMFSLCT